MDAPDSGQPDAARPDPLRPAGRFFAPDALIFSDSRGSAAVPGALRTGERSPPSGMSGKALRILIFRLP